MTQISAPFDRMLTRIRQELDDPTPNDEVLDALKAIGKAAIEEAERTKATLNDTYNQIEAFAFGVYFNGRVYRQGYLDKGKYRNVHTNAAGKEAKGAEKDRRGKYGRSQALHAIRDHKPTHRGYELYLTNAIWYSMIHEEWGLPILSQVVKDAVARIESEFGVEVSMNFISYPYS